MRLAKAAKRDLERIFDRIALDSGLGTAQRILSKFEESFHLLDSFEGVGTIEPELQFKGNQIRTLVVSSWRVYYATLQGERCALRIIHHAQDAANQNLIRHPDLDN